MFITFLGAKTHAYSLRAALDKYNVNYSFLAWSGILGPPSIEPQCFSFYFPHRTTEIVEIGKTIKEAQRVFELTSVLIKTPDVLRKLLLERRQNALHPHTLTPEERN